MQYSQDGILGGSELCSSRQLSNRRSKLQLPSSKVRDWDSLSGQAEKRRHLRYATKRQEAASVNLCFSEWSNMTRQKPWKELSSIGGNSELLGYTICSITLLAYQMTHSTFCLDSTWIRVSDAFTREIFQFVLKAPFLFELQQFLQSTFPQSPNPKSLYHQNPNQ